MKDATPGHLAKDAQLAGKAALAVTAAAIPVVGGSISAAIGVWETEALTRRFERFVERVEAKVAELGAGKLDADYVGTEAFEDAVLVALDGARRTSNAEKLEWIVGLLVGSALVDPPAQLDIESVLQAIGDLSPIELRAGRRIFLDGRKQSKLFPRSIAEPAIPDVDFHLKRLEAAGLIVREGTPDLIGFNHQGVRPTETFNRIMAVLKASGS